MQYRVWNAINMAAPAYYTVESPLDGWTLIQALKKQQEKDSKIICNVFGLENLRNSVWVEWKDDLLRTVVELEDPIEFSPSHLVST